MRLCTLALCIAALSGCAGLTREAPLAKVEPARAETYNAAALRLAAQGRHAEAIAQFRAALALSPDSAYLYNNLGYAHLLRGEPEQALRHFEQALRLDPGHAQALENTALARARVAERRVPAQPAAPSAVAAQPLGAPATGLIRIAPHVYELREARPIPRSLPPAPAQPARKPRLDVANGNGVPGLARQVAARLAARGLQVARVTNAQPFDHRHTVVYYRAGGEDEARRLAASLAGGARIAPARTLAGNVDLRIVIGQDAPTATALFASPAGSGAGLALAR